MGQRDLQRITLSEAIWWSKYRPEKSRNEGNRIQQLKIIQNIFRIWRHSGKPEEEYILFISIPVSRNKNIFLYFAGIRVYLVFFLIPGNRNPKKQLHVRYGVSQKCSFPGKSVFLRKGNNIYQKNFLFVRARFFFQIGRAHV